MPKKDFWRRPGITFFFFAIAHSHDTRREFFPLYFRTRSAIKNTTMIQQDSGQVISAYPDQIGYFLIL